MASDTSFLSGTSIRPWSNTLLAATLVAGSLAVHAWRLELSDPRRFVLVLAALGLFFAAPSERPLRLFGWLVSVAAVAWIGRWAATGAGGVWSWGLSSVAGALLAVRAGSRAHRYYLPVAGSDRGAEMRSEIQWNLRGSVLLFAAAFLSDGGEEVLGPLRAAALLGSAALFLRYLLLQAKHLKLPSERLRLEGLVPSQRWPVLLIVTLVGTSSLPSRALPGGDAGALLVTAMLVLVLASLVFVLALARMGWDKSALRRASFASGVALSFLLAAIVVELESWGTERFTFFQTSCTFALIVLPFANGVTRLFSDTPRLAAVLPPPILGVMSAPLAAMHGARWELASSGFLFWFAALMLGYHLVVVVRERWPGRGYLAASLASLGAMYVSGATAWSTDGGAWQLFIASFLLLLASVDRFAQVAGRTSA